MYWNTSLWTASIEERFWQFWFDAAVICCVFYWWCLWFSFETMGSVNTAMQQINLSRDPQFYFPVCVDFWRLWYLLTLGCILQWESWKVIGIPCLHSSRKSVYIHVTCWFMLELFNQRCSFKPALHVGAPSWCVFLIAEFSRGRMLTWSDIFIGR